LRTPREPSYFFSLTGIETAWGTSETMTRVFHHPELDELVLPYALPDPGIALLSVGNSVDPLPPTIVCSSISPCPEIAGPDLWFPLLLIGSSVAIALLGGVALRHRARKRAP
jgi:hypothetical protein